MCFSWQISRLRVIKKTFSHTLTDKCKFIDAFFLNAFFVAFFLDEFDFAIILFINSFEQIIFQFYINQVRIYKLVTGYIQSNNALLVQRYYFSFWICYLSMTLSSDNYTLHSYTISERENRLVAIIVRTSFELNKVSSIDNFSSKFCRFN